MSQFSAAAHPPLLPLAAFAAAIAMLVAFSVEADASNDGPSAAISSSTGTFQQAALTPHAYEPPALAPSAVVQEGTPAYRVEQNKVKFFFAASRAELRQSADQGLQAIAETWREGQKIQIAGFHDQTGNPQQNAVLAKKRALEVQKRLADLGVPVSAMQLNKPAVAQDTQDLAEARRVEVSLLKK